MQTSIKYLFLLFTIVTLYSCNETKQEEKKTEYTPLTSKEVQESLDDESIDPEYKAQLENLVAMMNEHPKSARLFAERANIFVLMKKTMQALQDITMAVDLEPDNAEYRINKSQLLRQFKRNKEALVEIEEALKLDPNSVGGHFNRGALFFNINYFEKALADFTFCIDARPEVGPPYFNRAFTYE